MRTDFLEKSINIKDIPKECPIDMLLVENNEKQIEKICEFLQSEEHLMLINGFRGTGKSAIVDFVSMFLNDDALVLKYNFLETTILDDLLLGFFEDFRNYTVQGKIIPPRIKTENFSQKINSYFNSIGRPICIILNSFESILKTNKTDILNFLIHLNKFSNVKIIITSRNFIFEDFQDITYSTATTLALSQPIFEKYLKTNGVKNIGVMSTELYKQSKGYYGVLNLAVKIMTLRQYSLVKFLEIFSKSYMPFSEFVYRESLALVDPVSAHVFRLLTVMRIPIHINLIKSLHLYNEERILFFVTNSLLSVDGESLYLKDFFREIIEHQIPDNVMIKLHSACVDLYNTQLPLKPLERDLRLSRQTMRNEIEYHSMFIPKKPNLNPQNVQVIDVNPVVEMTPQTVQEIEKEVVEKETAQISPPHEETKEEKLDKISFIIDDEDMLNNIADSIKDFVSEKIETNKIEAQNSKFTLTQLLNLAKKEEQNYNYKAVISLYQNALTKKDDDNFDKFLPTIYVKLAQSYKHLSDWYDALNYYTQAQDFYYNTSNTDKVAEIKLEIANIYYIMYKHDNARFILNELSGNSDLPNELKIRVNLGLAKLSNKASEEYEYYKNALPLVTSEVNKAITAELYYKFAGISDERNNTKTAVDYYKKCIGLDTNPKTNKFLSRALANLAELFDEAGSSNLAIKYYNQSIKIDNINKNYNGLYYSAIHLAEIYSSQDTNKSLDFMTQALSYAKQLNEPFYVADASLLLGDFYMLRRDVNNAYKYFISAYNVAKHSFSKDNLDKIQSRIDDVKRKLSEQDFKQLQDKYGK